MIQKQQKGRKGWIDNLRGICMLAILLDHTEFHYTGANIIDYSIYVTDALYLFFFISGYLIYKEGEACNLKKKTLSICRALIMPYFIFTTIIAIPKAVAHSNGIDISNILWNIFTGQASWFVVALAIAELAFVAAIHICKNNIAALAAICTAAYVAAIELAGHSQQTYPFQIDNALLAMPILLVGYAYHKYENHIGCGKIVTATSFSALILTKIYVVYTGTTLCVWPICISNNITFILNVITGCIAMSSLFKKLPSCQPIEWVGRHSLVYYFMCGGIPLTVSRLFCKVGIEYNGCYLNVLITYAAVCALSTIAVACIYKYAPFAVGKKRTR